MDWRSALLERILSAVGAGVDWNQLREKDLDTRTMLDLAREALSATRSALAADAYAATQSVRVVINDRLDIALASGAHGVHLGEASLPVSEAVRAKVQTARANFVVGVSCHSLGAAIAAARDGADYVFFGPVFATPSKAAFGPPQGLAKLAEVCRAVAVPVLAIGGVTAENAVPCLDAGATGIAAIRLFQQGADLPAALSKLRQHL